MTKLIIRTLILLILFTGISCYLIYSIIESHTLMSFRGSPADLDGSTVKYVKYIFTVFLYIVLLIVPLGVALYFDMAELIKKNNNS